MWRHKTSHGTFKNSSLFPENILKPVLCGRGMFVWAHDCINTHLHGLGPVPTQRTKPWGLRRWSRHCWQARKERDECNGRFFRWCIVWVNLSWSGLTTCFFPQSTAWQCHVWIMLTKDGWCALVMGPQIISGQDMSACWCCLAIELDLWFAPKFTGTGGLTVKAVYIARVYLHDQLTLGNSVMSRLWASWYWGVWQEHE